MLTWKSLGVTVYYLRGAIGFCGQDWVTIRHYKAFAYKVIDQIWNDE